MALLITQRQSAASSASTTSLIATYSPAATVNRLLVAICFTRGDVLTNPAGWTTAVNVDNLVNNDELRIAYKIAVGGETDVEFTWAANDTAGLSIFEVSGNDASSPLDRTASTGITGGVSALSSGTTGTTTLADEISFCGFGLRQSVSSPSLTNSFTLEHHLESVAQVATLLSGSRIVAGISTYETQASWTTAADAMGCIATFKAEAPVTVGGVSSPIFRIKRIPWG